MLPLSEGESKEELRKFLRYTFKDLLAYKPSRAPECVPAHVWFDFEVVQAAWQRRGFALDS